MLSTKGFRYYSLFVDDFSRFVWLYPLRQKSDALTTFKHFLNLIFKQFKFGIKTIQTDNGGEYIKIHQLCFQLGIKTQMSCPYTSEQNGRAERKHRHVVEIGLTLMAQASMSLQFW